MSYELPPLNLEHEVKKYDAKEVKHTVVLGGCKHKSVKFENGELRCKCGASWSGTRLHELEAALKNVMV
jgi:hypothetical protein